MKLVPVTKLDKRNKIISKHFVDDVMWENCDVIVTSLAIWRYPKAGFWTHSL